jgi:hypothetical protein
MRFGILTIAVSCFSIGCAGDRGVNVDDMIRRDIKHRQLRAAKDLMPVQLNQSNRKRYESLGMIPRAED